MKNRLEEMRSIDTSSMSVDELNAWNKVISNHQYDILLFSILENFDNRIEALEETSPKKDEENG